MALESGDENALEGLGHLPTASNPPDCEYRQGCWVYRKVSADVSRGAGDAVPIDPDLALVIALWPDLPAALKAGILAMVRAAGR